MLLPNFSLADTDLFQSGQITINPSSDAPTLTLQGTAFDSADWNNYGLTLSYHDSTLGTPKAISVVRIFRPSGQYQWQFSNAATPHNTERTAMVLDDDHSLKLIDPTNSANTIVLHPGNLSTDSSSGVYWNGQRLATMSEVVPIVNGAVTIGTSTTPSSLTINGAATATRLNLPATTDANSGVIYQDGDRFLHSYGTDNVFLGRYSGSFGQNSNGSIGGANVAVGSVALANLTTGGANVAVGAYALVGNQSGGANIALGEGALGSMTASSWNIGIGHGAGGYIHGDSNVFIGFHSGINMTSGEWNTGLGKDSLGANFNNPTMGTGDQNTAIGAVALFNVTTGIQNTVVGSGNGYSLSSGSNNILLGAWTGFSMTTGNANILIGTNVEAPDPTVSNMLSIGNLIYGTGLNGRGTDVSSGKIGIGVANPQAKLDVKGDTHVRGVLRVPAAGDISMGDFTAGTNPVPPQP